VGRNCRAWLRRTVLAVGHAHHSAHRSSRRHPG
jgi:hypothetical protein